MSQTGSDLTSFELNGRTVFRADGALRLADGTLAGADLDMVDAVKFMHHQVGGAWEEALRGALYPAEAIDVQRLHGHLMARGMANFVELDHHANVVRTWIKGEPVFDAKARRKPARLAHQSTAI